MGRAEDFEPPVETKLASGLRVVTAAGPPDAAACGFWVGTGSADDPPDQAGISHFLEHVAFLRGTETRRPAELSRLYDDNGAVAGASTGPDATVYAVQALADRIVTVVEALAEVVQRPAFAGVELERHRILDELASYEDDDDEAVDELWQRALYGDHPLARRPIGEQPSVERIGTADLRRWHELNYVAGDVVIASAGAVDHVRAVSVAESIWDRVGPPPRAPRQPPPPRPPAVAFGRRDIGQFLVLLGARAPGEADPEYTALGLLVDLLGGAASSRLWERLGEQLGLVYAVSAERGGTPREGQVVVSVAMRPEDLYRTLREVRTELDALFTQPPDKRELERVRAIAHSALLLEPRSAAEEADRIGRRASAGLAPISFADDLRAIDAVTLEELRAAARFLAPAGLTIAGVGPDEDAFRSAVAAAFA